ncbi:hypothetical protein [Shouchella miscanthi]|uniref:Uncharacterized protein n=1 Tax=Shouchella miscanthi TaxID=2598861 RepID=A0ABU6NIS0_9BACI|nr:hypothetical protein [Shouchella miscanthi]
MERYAKHIKEHQYNSLRTYQDEPVIGFYLSEDKNRAGIIEVNQDVIIDTEIEIKSDIPTLITLEGEEEIYVGIVFPDEIDLNEVRYVSLKETDIGNLTLDIDQEVPFSFGFIQDELPNAITLEIMDKNSEILDEIKLQ